MQNGFRVGMLEVHNLDARLPFVFLQLLSALGKVFPEHERSLRFLETLIPMYFRQQLPSRARMSIPYVSSSLLQKNLTLMSVVKNFSLPEGMAMDQHITAIAEQPFSCFRVFFPASLCSYHFN